MSDVTEVLDKQIREEISALTVSNKNYSSSERMDLKLKNYKYANIYMNNYGDPILDKNNNLIGYRINSKTNASVITYYNNNNLLCNKISISEFDENNLTFINEPMDS
jgi:hypothetical protein